MPIFQVERTRTYRKISPIAPLYPPVPIIGWLCGKTTPQIREKAPKSKQVQSSPCKNLCVSVSLWFKPAMAATRLVPWYRSSVHRLAIKPKIIKNARKMPEMKLNQSASECSNAPPIPAECALRHRYPADLLARLNPRINPPVKNIHDEIRRNHHRRTEQHRPRDHRHVQVEDTLHGQRTDARE